MKIQSHQLGVLMLAMGAFVAGIFGSRVLGSGQTFANDGEGYSGPESFVTIFDDGGKTIVKAGEVSVREVLERAGVMVDEAVRMKRARESRTFSRKKRHVWRTAGTVVGQLFVRVSERSERIFAAMCARGWRQ